MGASEERCKIPHGCVGWSPCISAASAQRWWGKGRCGREEEDHREMRALSLGIGGDGDERFAEEREIVERRAA